MHGSVSIQFTAVVWSYEGKGGWHFVSLPEEDSARIREIFKSEEQGWGRLPVEASIFLTGRISEDKSDMSSSSESASKSTTNSASGSTLPTSAFQLPTLKTAIWFDTKKNTYLLPIKADIRKNEGIDEGDEVGVGLRI